MKKFSKSIAALLLLLCFMLSLFTGCGSDSEKRDRKDRDNDIEVGGDGANNDDSDGGSASHKNAFSYELGINSNGGFYNGRAVIEYTANGKTYGALIDSTGKVLYKIEDGYCICGDIELGESQYFDICAFSNNDFEHFVVNEDGEVVASSTEDGFDVVIACGDGKALVYKDESSVNEAKICIGVIDNDGNWVQELKKVDGAGIYDEYLPNNYAKYVGCGMFLIYSKNYYGDDAESILYNSNTGEYKLLKGKCGIYNGSYSKHIEMYFVNDISYYASDSGSQGKYINTITTDFVVTEYGWYDSFCKQYTYNWNDVEYFTVYNLATGKTVTLSNYEADRVVSDLLVDGDYFVVFIRGVDGNDYFTAYDGNGNELFEPVRCSNLSSITFANGIISYQSVDGNQNFDIIDINGNVLAKDVYINGGVYGFSDDMALYWSYSDTDGFINTSGDHVLEKLYE